MPTTAPDVRLLDFEPAHQDFMGEVLAGLTASPKTLPCKYFYDERGSELFDRICELEEYYPTRTEMAIMAERAGEMAAAVGPRAMLVEYGSGSSLKTRILLDHLEDPVAYVPVDISREHLLATARSLAEDYPALEVLPVCADYTAPYRLPVPRRPARRSVGYFPGSTIGNFEAEAALAFLRAVAETVGETGGLLLGVDLKKDPAVLEAAYDDARGVTAEFNMNLLYRINVELGADFDLDAFRHRARWNEAAGRVEMHLESLREQTVRLDGRAVAFAAGETIHTESSHKYSPRDLDDMAAAAGFRVVDRWTDAADRFCVAYLAYPSDVGVGGSVE